MKKTSKKTRLLSVLLCVCMVLGLMPGLPFAVDAAAAELLTAPIDTGAEITLTDAAATGAVRYLDADGNEKFTVDYTVVDSDTTTMSNGWYVVKKEITVTGTITVTGEVHLILCDHSALNVAGVTLSTGNSLTIYAQSEDPDTMGSLNSTATTAGQAGIGGYKSGSGTLVINGGHITAASTESFCAGIGCGSNSSYAPVYPCDPITINGGVVTARSGVQAAAIGGSMNSNGTTVTVNGGIVIATAGKNGSGIGGGREGKGGSFTQNGGVVIAKPGHSDIPDVAVPIGSGANATDNGAATYNGGITFLGTAGKLNATKVTLDQSFEIPADFTLTVEAGKTLTIAEGGCLTISGTLINNGTIVNNGGILNQGTFTNNGSGSCGPYAKDHPVVTGGASCAFCGNADAPRLYDGVYYVSESSHMYWLAQQINAGSITSTVNIELVDDITLPADQPWTPIALPDGQVCNLNGNGNTLTIEQSFETQSSGNYGLFATLNYSTVKNLVLKGSITCDTTGSVGAIAGSSYRTTYENVVSYVTVTNSNATSGNAGGIAGYYGGKHDTANGRYSKLVNCAVYADVTGFYAGGLIGQSWNGTQYYDITGSLYVGNVTTTASDGAAGAIVGYQATDSNSCTFTNVFWNENDGLEFYGKRDTTSQVYSNTSSKTAEAFASGEVAWILNNGVTDGSQVWYQNLDMDAYPLLAGPAVYFGYSHICTDTEPIYSNAPGYLQDTPADHTYVADCDATCEYCDTVREISADHVLEYQNDGTQHWQYCSACQGILNSDEHSMIYEDTQTAAHKYYCEVCGYIEKTEGHWYESADLGDGIHDYHCIYCGRITTSVGEHTMVCDDNGDGTHFVHCSVCDYVEQNSAEHTLVYTDMENGTHKSSCDMCGYAGQPVAHTLISVDNWDDTHTRKCKWCDSIQGTEEHTFENKGCWNVCSCGRATENYDSHSFDADGFCTACGGYQKPTVDPGEDPEWDYDDVYLISNAGQLYWFADYVNNVNNNITGKLMADIDLNPGFTFNADGSYSFNGIEGPFAGGIAGLEPPRMWTPIGSGSPCYAGSFDGNGFTVSGVYAVSEGRYVGLFGNTDYNYEIKNLGITNSYLKGADHVGGLIGYAYTFVKNCFVTNTVYVSGSHSTAAFIGYNGGEICNSYAMADTFVDTNYGSCYNCYALTEGDGITAVTSEDFISGKAAYLLQQGVTEEGYYDENDEWITYIPEIWGQTIGEDAYPVLGGAKVYRIIDCMGNSAFSNTDADGEHIDTDSNGHCDVCDCVMESAKPVVKGTAFSLSFEDEIQVNFYYTVSDMTYVEEHGLLVFYSDPGTADFSKADTVYNKPTGDSAYGISTAGIAAREMGDTRYYAAYAKLSDGSYVYSAIYGYSPKQYAMNMLGKASTSEGQKVLCVALLNFGAAAQEYFGYKTDDLMNAELTDAQKALVIPYDKTLFTGAVEADEAKIGEFAATATGFSGESATVSLEGAFSVNFYFTPDAAVSGDLTLYIWTPEAYGAADTLTAANASETVTMSAHSDGSYWGQVSDIAAKRLDDTYYVAGVYTDADGNTHCTGVIAYSVSQYCLNKAVDGCDMQQLACATAMYGYYAKQYFTA